MIFSKIVGTGAYLPPQIVTNSDLQKIMETTDEWIQQRTGIKERRWVEQDKAVGTSDLALEAAKIALADAKIEASEIDMIIMATLSPDHDFPGTGCFLQPKLGLAGIPALDIRQQCTGFIYGLSIADQFIRSGTYKKILLVGAEIPSRGLNKTTAGRDIAVLFGDGAGACVIAATNDPTGSRVLSTHLHADGRFAKELWIQAPGSAYAGPWMSKERVEKGEHFGAMNGKTVFVHASRRMPEVVLEALEANHLKLSDVDLFVFHQANLRINEMVAKQLGIPEDKVFNTIEKFGNTTAATIPIGFSEAIKAGKLKPGMLVATAAFGSGFTWASALIRW